MATLIICKPNGPRIPLEYVNHPRTSSLLRLQQFLRKQARKRSRP